MRRFVIFLMLWSTILCSLETVKQQFLFNRNDIERVKNAVKAGNNSFNASLEKLRVEADIAFEAGPFSVTFDDALPPSGDKHDYVSMAKYWWPDPENPDGPYIRKDGVTNPAAGLGDKAQRRGLYRAVEVLGAAYFFFEEEQYAAKASELLHIWFIHPDTRMNPHMQYGQYVPGRNKGRQYGIIETRPFIRIIDAVQLMRNSAAWTEKDHANLQEWFAQYLDWLLTGEWGRLESTNGNNHETACNLQIASYALFVDWPDVAHMVFERFNTQTIMQIEPDGTMPREIARTKGLHYSSMNLSLMMHIAELASTQLIDIYSFETHDGRSIKNAFHFLKSYFAKPDKWPYQQITKSNPDYDELFYILRRSFLFENEYKAESVLNVRFGEEFASHRGQLYWPITMEQK